MLHKHVQQEFYLEEIAVVRSAQSIYKFVLLSEVMEIIVWQLYVKNLVANCVARNARLFVIKDYALAMWNLLFRKVYALVLTIQFKFEAFDVFVAFFIVTNDSNWDFRPR